MGNGKFLQSLTFQDRRLESGRTKYSKAPQRPTTEKKIEKSYQRLYLGSPKSFKDWKMLKYVVKSSSFCRAWDRVIISRDDSDRLVRNLK
ncbi:hypothetical protein TNCV_4443011 [Trichonephila clavipes]|nr:hypothetical protein TNCV_4443011 [Trichonephila clavipes]